MRVLIVDDDSVKADDVRHSLTSALGESAVEVVLAEDVAAARRAMVASAFDLVVLDVALPAVRGGKIEMDAGVRLLEEIVGQPSRFKTPNHFVGLTGHRPVLSLYSGRFASWLWTLVFYAPERSEWRHSLQARARHIQNSLAGGVVATHGRTDIAVLTALQEPEGEAVLASASGWVQDRVEGDETIYWRTSHAPGGTAERSVVTCVAARMGMPAAAVAAAKLIANYRPRLLVCCGIMAGVKGKVSLGDVVVPTSCWDWGNGKWTIDGVGTRTFQPAPHQVSISPRVRERLRGLAANPATLAGAWASWDGDRPAGPPKIILGPVASGAAVLADGVTVADLVRQHRELKGIEMELYAAYVAAEEAGVPRPEVVGLKSVVDFADGEKSDKYQRYAAYVSARAMWTVAESLLD